MRGMSSVFMAGSKVKTLMTKHETTQLKVWKGAALTNESPYVKGQIVAITKMTERISR